MRILDCGVDSFWGIMQVECQNAKSLDLLEF